LNGILLDTNVISELTRDEPDEHVVSFLATHQDLWVSTVVLHELEFGLRLLPRGRRREELESAVAKFVASYTDRMLPVDRREAQAAAVLRVRAQQSGRILHLGDALIGGTAMAHDLAVATRNVTDFDGLDLVVINPWQEQ
jgi:predicted nucleic acid-binding protein